MLRCCARISRSDPAGEAINESILREKAREAIRNGTLPARKPDRTFGGPGSGVRCALCDELIPQSQMELEIEFKRQGVTPGLARYQLHLRCLAAWETALRSWPDGGTGVTEV